MNKCFPFNKGFSNEKDLLFCFHHAGGSATQFRSWLEYISLIDVVPVELPGKATRRAEKYVESMAELVPHLAHASWPGACFKTAATVFEPFGSNIVHTD